MNIQISKEPIIKIQPYLNQKIIVQFIGGRQLTGILKSFDNNLNIILDDAIENLRDPNDLSILTNKTRELGLVILRGTQIITITSDDGTQQIQNPFLQEE